MAKELYDAESDLKRIRASHRRLRERAEKGIDIVDPSKCPGESGCCLFNSGPIRRPKVRLFAADLKGGRDG